MRAKDPHHRLDKEPRVCTDTHVCREWVIPVSHGTKWDLGETSRLIRRIAQVTTSGTAPEFKFKA